MADEKPLKLFIFAVDSYGAATSFDHGETDIDMDQTPVIVGHQYAKSLDEAKRAMAEELADSHLELETEKPDFYTDDPEAYDKLTAEQMQEVDEWDREMERIEDQLQFFELAIDGEHSTYFMS